VDTDLEHVRALLNQLFESEKAVSIVWRENHDKVHDREHEAIVKAENAVNARLEAMNELRAQINTERGRFVLKEQYDERHEALAQRLTMEVERLAQRVQLSYETMERRLTAIERIQTTQQAQSEYQKSQQQSTFVKWGIILTLASLIMSFLVNFVLKTV
jgi:DNA polymerase sigma